MGESAARALRPCLPCPVPVGSLPCASCRWGLCGGAGCFGRNVAVRRPSRTAAPPASSRNASPLTSPDTGTGRRDRADRTRRRPGASGPPPPAPRPADA
ncbi:hypothetical protein FGW37_30040 [Streptomyces rectiverticillatus]|nr:hypothetical protein FGW37_30040 [Streptomyces rectiverticillatus]